MRRVTLAVMVVCAVNATAFPSVAGPSYDVIVLRGSGTAYVDVVFDEPFLLDEEETRMDYDGTYAGWFMHKLGEKVRTARRGNIAGSYVLREFAYPGQSVTTSMGGYGFKTKPLAAGRYRMYLMSDGPAEVTIPVVRGAHSMFLRPSKPTVSDVAVQHFSVGPGGTVIEALTTPVLIRPSTMGVSMVTAYSEPGLTVESMSACFVDPGDECTGFTGASGWIISADQDYSMTVSVHYDPGLFAYGDYEARQQMTNAGSTTEAHGAHILLDLKGLKLGA